MTSRYTWKIYRSVVIFFAVAIMQIDERRADRWLNETIMLFFLCDTINYQAIEGSIFVGELNEFPNELLVDQYGFDDSFDLIIVHQLLRVYFCEFRMNCWSKSYIWTALLYHLFLDPYLLNSAWSRWMKLLSHRLFIVWCSIASFVRWYWSAVWKIIEQISNKN